MRTVRSIDTLMRNRFGEDETVLAAWKSASRVHSPAVRGAGSGASETPSAGAAA